MNVTATLDGESVTIVDIDVNGSQIYITYVDASSNLKTKIKYFEENETIASSAVVN